jgi:signal transduction histidine kinase
LKNVKLSAVLNKVLKEQGRKLKNANINLEQFVNKDLDILPVRGDEYFVYEILSNLVSNAIKYTTAGNIKISADLGYTKGEIQGRGGKARYAVVIVEDTGIGIPRDEQGKVFNKFFRASNAGGKFSGNGLGLFIVRELVEKMDGKIWFESMEGKGSKFGFSLPLVNH